MESQQSKKAKPASFSSKKKVEEIHHSTTLVGRIVEKGFSSSSSSSSSSLKPQHPFFPQPSVLPFPVARHRSHGPHWAPVSAEMDVDGNDGEDDDKDATDFDPIASFANPIERKQKKGLDFSTWRELVAKESSMEPQLKKNEAKPSKEREEIIRRSSHSSALSQRVRSDMEVSDGERIVEVNKSELQSDMEVDALLGKLLVGGAESRVSAEPNGHAAPSLMDDIDAENIARLKSMSEDEIAEAQAEIMEKMNPALVEMLKKRGRDKLGGKKSNGAAQEKEQTEAGGGLAVKSRKNSATAATTSEDWMVPGIGNNRSWKDWSERVEKVRELRFSLDGNLVEIGSSKEQSNGQNPNFSVQNVSERDFLRTEGDPAAVGYTIKEAVALVRSMVPGQRGLALQLLTSVLNQALHNLQKELGSSNKKTNFTSTFVDWQAVWVFALGPEPQMALSLRIALDDNHDSVVLACAKVIHCLLSFDKNEKFFNSLEKLPTHGKAICTAPVFRSRPELNGGFLRGGFWKYNAKPSNILPLNDENEDDEDEGRHTIQDDVVVAEQDVAAGLIRMGVLARICYLLEMDPLPALEECLVSILVALARHSLKAASAIMKCPRLIQAVIKILRRQISMELYPSQIKATSLLKVLSKSSKHICLEFVKGGGFQAAMWRWYKKPLTLEQWIQSGKEHCRLISFLMVEQLRLWRVCIQYGYCIPYFADFFPSMCLWLSPPTFDKLIENNILDEFTSITREVYLVLGALAQKLPNLHSVEQLNKEDNSFFNDNVDAWSWSYIVPMVDFAVKWLALKNLPFVSSLIGRAKRPIDYDQVQYVSSIVWVVSAVLHMLSSVFDRIAPEEVNGLRTVSLPWLPQFVPKVGLEIVKNGFLNFLDSGDLKFGVVHSESASLAGSLCYLRHEADCDVALSFVSCLHGLVQIASSVDRCIQLARNGYCSEHQEGDSSNIAAEILKEGIIKWAQNDLKVVLEVFMPLISSKRHIVQSIEMFGRGGPAPGVGVGWGSSEGGFWSLSVLLAQVDSQLILDLLQYFPVVLKNKLHSVGRMVTEKDRSHGTTLVLQKLINVFGMCLVAGPGDRTILYKALDFLLQVPILKYLNVCISELQHSMGFKSLDVQCEEEEYLLFSKILNEHFRNRWLDVKKKPSHKVKEDDGHKYGASDDLQTILEDVETTDMADEYEDGKSLLIEWAHQRLPLPAHWFLSAISSIGDHTMKGMDSSANVLDVAKGGLLLLLGMEAMNFLCSDQNDSPVSGVPLAWRLHALSTALHVGMDVLEDEKSRNCYETLQEVYGGQLDQSRSRCVEDLQNKKNDVPVFLTTSLEGQVSSSTELDFQRQIHESYSTFVENLIEQFAAISYGDLIYGRQVALYLHRSVEVTVRLAAWNALSNAHVLELLPPLNKCIAKAEGYLEPVEDNEKLLEAYVKSWISGGLDRAATRASVSFSLALHHLSFFIFNTTASEKLVLRNKLARSLLRSYSQKQHQEGMILSFVKHRLPETGESLCKAELGRRLELLRENCEENSSLLAQVEKLKSRALI